MEGEQGTPGEEGTPGEPGKPPAGGGGAGGRGGRGGKQGERGRRGPRDSRTLLVVLCSLAGLLLLIVAVMSTVTLVQQTQIRANATKIAKAQEKLVGVDALCMVAIAQRSALEQQVANSKTYLASPAATEAPGLASFVRTLSLPQLRARLKTEKPPVVCREIVRAQPKHD